MPARPFRGPTVNFAQWQELTPDLAAREVRRRAASLLSQAQARAVLAHLPDESVLAAEFAASPKGSPLRGVPYALKDLFDVAGMPTRAGSSFLAEVRPEPTRDGALVRELRTLGAVHAAKTHLFEFAWGLTGENAHYGPCERPGSPGRTSGGSSSGAAAAVAAGIVPFAIGTDTGGSIRVPAAFCGLFGYRGMPHHPWIADAFPLARSFDTAGWFTRTAADMATAMDALVGLRRSDRALRGVFIEPAGVDRDVADACRPLAEALAAPADAATRDEIAEGLAPAPDIYGVLGGREGWEVHRLWADPFRERYGPLVRARLDRARALSEPEIAAAEAGAAAIRLFWTRFFLTHDFLVMPAAPCAAFTEAECTPANRVRILALTAPASLGGLPVLVLPVVLPSGLSAALQVIVNHPQSPAVSWALEQMAAFEARQSVG